MFKATTIFWPCVAVINLCAEPHFEPDERGLQKARPHQRGAELPGSGYLKQL